MKKLQMSKLKTEGASSTKNKEKRTEGVDKVKCTTSTDKLNIICFLKRRGYHSHSLKRVFIAKSSSKNATEPLSVD